MKMTLQEIKRQGNFTCNISHLDTLCKSVGQQPGQVYELIAQFGGEADSVTREAIFSYITDKYNNGNYALVYDKWLRQSVRSY